MTFYISWEILSMIPGDETRLIQETIEAEDFDSAEEMTRERFASGLVELTEALGPDLAEKLIETRPMEERQEAVLYDRLGPTMAEFVRILVPAHQITRVAVAKVPIQRGVNLSEVLGSS